MEPLGVMLLQGLHRADEEGHRAEGGDDEAPGPVEALAGAIQKKVLIRPKIPVLIMTPERRALMGEGAIEWASGSHSWPKGKIPALNPKPARRSP